MTKDLLPASPVQEDVAILEGVAAEAAELGLDLGWRLEDKVALLHRAHAAEVGRREQELKVCVSFRVRESRARFVVFKRSR